ncbi:exosortase-associated EpsI family protein [Rariglobus hedericola]|uniref:Exosortase-associated EpsI family protein n=1 Tax=Rariglobus hedericola TaxID=2597822 RepID=A0A556QQP9_9BACT|nr:exosortase-associated EpsI family protein [Rariglobus hedericola]TSJ78967.1 exosortase-associated EpsI family protein [Rariglobus hedericola]
MRKFLLCFLGGGLILATGFQFFGLANQRKNLISPDVSRLIPNSIPGWLVEDKPIAESPEMQRAVSEVLNFDSAVFRVYRRGSDEITVYMAYWLPGKIHPQGVDAHTPDICWPNNGWKMTKLPKLTDQVLESGRSLAVPNNRRFMAGGQDLTVLFWHINGHKIRQSFSVFEEGMGMVERTKRRIYQVWTSVTTPAQQQLFIRISSNRDITQQLNEPPIRACTGLMDRVIGGENLYTVKQ